MSVDHLSNFGQSPPCTTTLGCMPIIVFILSSLLFSHSHLMKATYRPGIAKLAMKFLISKVMSCSFHLRQARESGFSLMFVQMEIWKWDLSIVTGVIIDTMVHFYSVLVMTECLSCFIVFPENCLSQFIKCICSLVCLTFLRHGRKSVTFMIILESEIYILYKRTDSQLLKGIFFWTGERYGGWLTPLSTIFQLYRGGQFYWWRKLE